MNIYSSIATLCYGFAYATDKYLNLTCLNLWYEETHKRDNLVYRFYQKGGCNYGSGHPCHVGVVACNVSVECRDGGLEKWYLQVAQGIVVYSEVG